MCIWPVEQFPNSFLFLAFKLKSKSAVWENRPVTSSHPTTVSKCRLWSMTPMKLFYVLGEESWLYLKLYSMHESMIRTENMHWYGNILVCANVSSPLIWACVLFTLDQHRSDENSMISLLTEILSVNNVQNYQSINFSGKFKFGTI